MKLIGVIDLEREGVVWLLFWWVKGGCKPQATSQERRLAHATKAKEKEINSARIRLAFFVLLSFLLLSLCATFLLFSI